MTGTLHFNGERISCSKTSNYPLEIKNYTRWIKELNIFKNLTFLKNILDTFWLELYFQEDLTSTNHKKLIYQSTLEFKTSFPQRHWRQSKKTSHRLVFITNVNDKRSLYRIAVISKDNDKQSCRKMSKGYEPAINKRNKNKQ